MPKKLLILPLPGAPCFRFPSWFVKNSARSWIESRVVQNPSTFLLIMKIVVLIFQIQVDPQWIKGQTEGLLLTIPNRMSAFTGFQDLSNLLYNIFVVIFDLEHGAIDGDNELLLQFLITKGAQLNLLIFELHCHLQKDGLVEKFPIFMPADLFYIWIYSDLSKALTEHEDDEEGSVDVPEETDEVYEEHSDETDKDDEDDEETEEDRSLVGGKDKIAQKLTNLICFLRWCIGALPESMRNLKLIQDFPAAIAYECKQIFEDLVKISNKMNCFYGLLMSICYHAQIAPTDSVLDHMLNLHKHYSDGVKAIFKKKEDFCRIIVNDGLGADGILVRSDSIDLSQPDYIQMILLFFQTHSGFSAAFKHRFKTEYESHRSKIHSCFNGTKAPIFCGISFGVEVCSSNSTVTHSFLPPTNDPVLRQRIQDLYDTDLKKLRLPYAPNSGSLAAKNKGLLSRGESNKFLPNQLSLDRGFRLTRSDNDEVSALWVS